MVTEQLDLSKFEDIIKPREVAEFLHVDVTSVYRWIEDGRLPALQPGGSERNASIRIIKKDLKEFLISSKTVIKED
jgi:excisionase family DNA binding protein